MYCQEHPLRCTNYPKALWAFPPRTPRPTSRPRTKPPLRRQLRTADCSRRQAGSCIWCSCPETFHDLLAAPRSRCATTRASSKRPDGRQLTHSRTVLFSRCGQGGPATNHPLSGEPPMHSLRMAGDSAGVRTGGVERNWFRHPLAASPHPRPSRASTPPQPSPPGTFATLQHGPWRRTRAMLCAVALSPLRARHDAATGVRVGPVHHRPPPAPLSPGLSEECAYRKNPAALG